MIDLIRAVYRFYCLLILYMCSVVGLKKLGQYVSDSALVFISRFHPKSVVLGAGLFFKTGKLFRFNFQNIQFFRSQKYINHLHSSYSSQFRDYFSSLFLISLSMSRLVCLYCRIKAIYFRLSQSEDLHKFA